MDQRFPLGYPIWQTGGDDEWIPMPAFKLRHFATHRLRLAEPKAE
jgi:hypothetical protein